MSGGGADSDPIYKEIEAEDVGALTPYGLLAAIDSAPTPEATFLMQLWNQSIPNPKNQARSAMSGGGADSDSICKEIDATDVRAMTPCGGLSAMDSAPNLNETPPMQLWNQLIPNPKNKARSAMSGRGVDSGD